MLRSASRAPDAYALTRIDALTRGSFDWETYRALAKHHGMTSLVARALSPGGARSSSSEMWNQLIEDRRVTATQNLSATAELLQILGDLNEAGIDSLVVKGPVAGITLYGDVSLRPFLDLDVVVAPRDTKRAIECLAGRGYNPELDLNAVSWRRYFRRYFELVCVHSQTRIVVDLHWALLDPRYRFSAVLDGWRERAVFVPIGGRPVRTLCREDTLLFSLLHAAKHQWSLLRLLLDTALAIEVHRDLDWDMIARAVERAPGCRRVIAVGLRLVELLFGVPVSTFAARWIVTDARAGELVRETFAVLTSATVPLPQARPWPWRQPFYKSMASSDRLRYAYDWLVAPTPLEWAAVPLPASLGWAYPAIRVMRLSRKHLWRRRARAPAVVEA